MMNKIISVPIEPMELRYSSQWIKWFEQEFNRLGYPSLTIMPDRALTNKIRTGEFLDVLGTNHFKAQQLAIICELIDGGDIEENDVLFFHDLWFPGLEMLQYIRDGGGPQFKITGCMHAGTWDQFDFLSRQGMEYWAKRIENAWFSFVDKVFVATDFHKSLILSSRILDADKIKVTGFPIYPDSIQESEIKLNRIVFPHRLAPEKQPDCFDMLRDWSNDHGSLAGYDFFKTMENWYDKQEYYRQLANSNIAISFALQETWGIAMQEAALSGAIPVVPDRLSYSELYLNCFKYPSGTTKQEDVENARELISKINKNPRYFKGELGLQQQIILTAGRRAIPAMIREMAKLLTTEVKEDVIV